MRLQSHLESEISGQQLEKHTRRSVSETAIHRRKHNASSQYGAPRFESNGYGNFRIPIELSHLSHAKLRDARNKGVFL